MVELVRGGAFPEERLLPFVVEPLPTVDPPSFCDVVEPLGVARRSVHIVETQRSVQITAAASVTGGLSTFSAFLDD